MMFRLILLPTAQVTKSSMCLRGVFRLSRGGMVRQYAPSDEVGGICDVVWADAHVPLFNELGGLGEA